MSKEPKFDDSITKPYRSAVINSKAMLETERVRLEAEREACKRTLERLSAEELALETREQAAETRLDPALLGRLHSIAAMRTDLRTAFHATLGGLQMLLLDTTLSEQQLRQTEMVMSAGLQLFEKVFSLLDISQIENTAVGLKIDHAPLSVQIAARGDGGAPIEGSLSPADAPNVETRRLRVLVAEDIDVNRHIAAGFLEAAGHGVHTAENGVSAVIAASTMDFDVILMDISMPELDGIEATRRIRALSGARGRTPIVALTAFDSEEEIEACRRAGMDGYLAKPFRHDTFIEAISRAVGDPSRPLAGHLAPAAKSPPAPFAADPAPRGPLTIRKSGEAQDGGSRLSGMRQTHPPEAATPKSYAHLLSAERENYQNASGASKPSRQWLDIVSPWHGTTKTKHPQNAAPSAAAARFSLRLRAVDGQRGYRRLVDDTLTCEPAREGEQHEFHWLVYLDDAHPDAGTFSARCDLWRWSRGAWQSIGAPGAAFRPEEVFEQGWRYCGPCMDPTVTIEVF